MSRIQIPLDVLTSRLNLSDRFAGVRSQSIASRFANLKPISEFLDLKRLSKPANFGEAQSRVNYNLGYFSSNYAVLFVMLSIYSLLTNPLLLFVIFLVVGGFFRGGGLDGRPRSPKVVPSWGRPPGAKGSKRRKQWERERELWQEQSRVEELDSDDTDTQGVGLDFGKKRFASDPLQFTEVDFTSKSRARRAYAYDSDESEEDSEESDNENTSALQVALRDKEEALVQSALARIRRAQEKGKREVKLDPEELDALEKRRKRMQSAATSKDKKDGGSSSGSERRRRSDRDLITVPIPAGEPKSRKNGKSKRSEDVPPYPVGPPGMLVQGADGTTYAPLGYHPSQAGPSHNSPTRPRSATSQQPRATPPSQFTTYQPQTNRHYSDGNRPTSSSSNGSRRPLPDEEGWIPAYSRPSSFSSQTHTVDPFEYQISSEQPPPIPQQYMQAGGRRNLSGPAEVVYSSLHRSPPTGSGYPAAAGGPGSDPVLRRRSSRRDDSSEEEEDESDDLGNGVQVFVEGPEPERDRTVSRKPVGSRRKGKGKGR